MTEARETLPLARMAAEAEVHAETLNSVGNLVLATRQGEWPDASQSIDGALIALTYPGTTDLEGGVRVLRRFRTMNKIIERSSSTASSLTCCDRTSLCRVHTATQKGMS